MAGLSPVAYLELMPVLPAERSDLVRTQLRNPAAPSGSKPRISASQALRNTRRR